VAIPDGPAKDNGIAVGESAAAAMIALRANDGSAPPQFYVPPSANPSEWQITPPPCTAAGGIFLHWRNVARFGIQISDQFRSDPPPAVWQRRGDLDSLRNAMTDRNRDVRETAVDLLVKAAAQK
jgi:hypothetical protein